MFEVWKKKSQKEIEKRIFSALDQNVNYENESVLGIPASYLDDKVFYQDNALLKDAPYLSTLIQNPNHIGCHTLGESEPYFRGTQDVERELIDICAIDILKGDKGKFDGYLASGGTEANMQAIWIYRNYYMNEKAYDRDEICIMCSEDSHYSMAKAANVFALDMYSVPVIPKNRRITVKNVEDTIERAKNDGKKCFIVVSNMMTTMFGSVDNIDNYTIALKSMDIEYKIHIDGAYGGFYYPFVDGNISLSFQNDEIDSFTLDAHKMAQAPYGTGIFIIRKNMIHHANTKEASYVEGEDYTLIGSRSGANAVAVWMILVKNGPFGWREKIFILQKRTEWICEKLDNLHVKYYRHSGSNIITIHSEYLNKDIVKEFGLVPDNHQNPKWYKIVVMEHVTIEKLIPLIDRIKVFLSEKD